MIFPYQDEYSRESNRANLEGNALVLLTSDRYYGRDANAAWTEKKFAEGIKRDPRWLYVLFTEEEIAERVRGVLASSNDALDRRELRLREGAPAS